jgi:hypothetical protein
LRQAAEHNLADNGVGNVTVVRMSSEDFVGAYSGVREFERLRLKGVNLHGYGFKTGARRNRPTTLTRELLFGPSGSY